MWIKYDYLCTHCDALLELTTKLDLIMEPDCSCENPQMIRINRHDVTQITENHIDTIGQAHYN